MTFTGSEGSVAAVSNLTVRYGTRRAIEDLSLEVPEGCTGLLGPNGAGKTTLIKALLGFFLLSITMAESAAAATIVAALHICRCRFGSFGSKMTDPGG